MMGVIYHCQLASPSVIYLLVELSSLYIVPKGMCYSLTIVSSLNAELIRSTFINEVIFYITTITTFCQLVSEVQGKSQ